MEKTKILETPYKPVFWAFNRHMQTISLFALSSLEWLWAEPIKYTREEVEAFDAPNVLYLDWAKLGLRANKHKITHEAGSDTPVVLCIHGLGDDGDIPYVKRFVRLALQRGYRVCVYNYWRYDFEESRDLNTILERIQEKYPTAPIAAVGWSAGVYPLLRYLQKTGTASPLVAAVCQSGCLDFPQAVEDVLGSENATYGIFLTLQSMKCIFRHLNNDKLLSQEQISAVKRAVLEEPGNPMRLYNRFLYIIRPKGTDVNKPEEFHPLGSPAHIDYTLEGDVQDLVPAQAAYYTHRAIDHMKEIQVTTLILHAEDDPIVVSGHVDWRKVESNRHVIVAITKRGGHVAWHQGFTPWGDTWSDCVAMNFIGGVLETHNQTHFFVELVRQSMNSLTLVSAPPAAPQKQSSASPKKGSSSSKPNFTPRAMSRICSASDLTAFPSPDLVSRRKAFTRLVDDSDDESEGI